MCVSNPDCSSFAINRCHPAPTPTGFTEIVSDDFPRPSCGRILPLLRSTKQSVFSGCVSLSSHLNYCHVSVTKRNSVCRLDQVLCDRDCWAGRHLSGSDNRVRDVRLALRSANRLAVRFAAICSTFNSSAGPVPDRNSHN
jgi:hypothetical protein